MNEENRRPLNLWVAVPMIMQIAVVIMLLWGFLGKAWDLSWLAPYIGVVLSLELLFYNSVVKKGQHPIKTLYPILILIGCAFFFTIGFVWKGWSYSWIALAIAAVGILIVIPIDLAIGKKAKAKANE